MWNTSPFLVVSVVPGHAENPPQHTPMFSSYQVFSNVKFCKIACAAIWTWDLVALKPQTLVTPQLWVTEALGDTGTGAATTTTALCATTTSALCHAHVLRKVVCPKQHQHSLAVLQSSVARADEGVRMWGYARATVDGNVRTFCYAYLVSNGPYISVSYGIRISCSTARAYYK